jgi:tetratricopeptide (TPR) repeat protein
MSRHSPDTGEPTDRLVEMDEIGRKRTAINLTKRAQRCANDPQHYARAADLLEQAVNLVPGDETLVQNYVGYCTEIATYHLQDGKYTEAVMFFTRALHYAPNDPESWLDLGTAYANQDNALEACRAWQDALRYLEANSKPGT